MKTALRCDASCAAFEVICPDGRIGVVEAVLEGPTGEPEELAVRAGLFSRRILFIPVEEVVEVDPGARRVLLDRPPRLTGSVSLDEWLPRAAA